MMSVIDIGVFRRSFFIVVLFMATFLQGSQIYVSNIGNTTSPGSVSVIDPLTNTVIKTLAVGVNPSYMAAAPNGTRVYVANKGSDSISIINTSNNTVIKTVSVGVNPIAVVVSPDSSKVYVANNGSNNVTVINAATATVATTIPVESSPYDIAILPNGREVYVTNSGSATVSAINTSDYSVTSIDVGNRPRFIAITPDGTRACVANTLVNTVSVIDTSTKTELYAADITVRPFLLAITSNSSNAYISCNGKASLFNLNIASEAVLEINLEGGNGSAAVAITEDNKQVYVSTIELGAAVVQVLQVATDTVSSIISVGDMGLDVSYSSVVSDGKQVFVANQDDDSVSVIDTLTNTVIATIPVGDKPFFILVSQEPSSIWRFSPVKFQKGVSL